MKRTPASPLSSRWFLLIALTLCAPEYVQAQWSAAPVVAIGPVIPAGSLRKGVREGAAIKVGVWFRAPRIPVGVTAEALLVQFADGATREGLDRARGMVLAGSDGAALSRSSGARSERGGWRGCGARIR